MNPTVLLLVSEYSYFCSHRLDLARALVAAGYTVKVVTRCPDEHAVTEHPGIDIIPLDLRRSAADPVHDVRTVRALCRILEREQPTLMHNVSLKLVFLGGITALLKKVPVTINALTGLGYLYQSTDFRARCMRVLLWPVFYFLLRGKNCWTVLQNNDDRVLLEKTGLIEPLRTVLIRGSGVNLEQFTPAPEAEGRPRVLLPARLLWDKGVGEFAAAARLLKQEGVDAEFILAGDVDAQNPNSISEPQIKGWHYEGIINWVGYREDMQALYASVHVVCLPSYREGLPKVLLEASACGRPLVSTDVPGCREAVVHGDNGLLVAVKDVHGLAEALRTLISDPVLRKSMGSAARKRVETEFSVDHVNTAFLTLYKKVLAGTGTQTGGAGP